MVEREFGADPELKKLYHTYLVMVLFGGFLWWMIPVVTFVTITYAVDVGVILAVSFFLPLIIGVSITLYWIPKFQSSICYILEDDRVTVTKGVWWKTESFVPYNRITNVNTYQGPISRHFGLGKVSIQTAGFSGSSRGVKTAEATIFGIKNFQETKDKIMEFITGFEPQAVEAEAKPPKNINQQILAELRQIRKTLQK